MVTRIVMDINVPAGVPEPHYQKGEVYDSRSPEGTIAYIPQHKLDEFIAEGWAHEQSWEEWEARLDVRRKAMLNDPQTDEDTKRLIRLQDAYAAPITAAIEIMDGRQSCRTAVSCGNGACQVVDV